MVLYFPVSALVTLFANILQNPQDPRARSDVKLMNLVVNFLSLLATDEENGSVKRMLNVCSEFERIAKVVLDKTERESHSRRKRKPADEKESDRATPSRRQSVATPGPSASPTSSGDYGNDFSEILQANGFNPTLGDGPNGNGLSSPMNLASFQQPFVPQDLWQMPMTLEWDWADMTSATNPFDPHDPSSSMQ